MGAGKQRLWSWAVKGSPHRCSPDPAPLAEGRRRRRRVIARKEAPSGASYITLLPAHRSDRRSASTLEYARSRIVREAKCDAPQARPPVPNVPCIGDEGSLPIFTDIASRKDAVSDAVIIAAEYTSEV
jgi:hypothetical protein